MMMETKKRYAKIFTSMFMLSAFTIGGGYVIVPLMKERFVEKLKWMDEEEMLDIIAISQSAPGAIAINSAILVGYRLQGGLGALLSVLGAILPPMFIMAIIASFYEVLKANSLVSSALLGMQAGVAAVIVDAVLSFAKTSCKEDKVLKLGLIFLIFVAASFFKINILILLLASIGLGILTSVIGLKSKKGGMN